ncbi:hypothetical protein LCGC14_1320280 [marine sediment metagenome]|uniref:Peptidase S1 domain-containing protein n=1 Tax=marine sediment metagenome TaxID=412755 RepID=A0A0F9NM32_9ZZZZ
MKYTILILALVALCSMTPLERTVTLEHENQARSTVINVGEGFFLGAGHCAAHGIDLFINGNLVEVRDWSEEPDWAIFYSEFYADAPVVETAPIIPGEVCYWFRDGEKYEAIFDLVYSDGTWEFHGEVPIAGDSGTGVFNADDELVAIVVASITCSGDKHPPRGLATAVLGLIDQETPKVQPTPPQGGG